MYAQNVKLENSDKTHRRWICLAEAERMVKRGEAIRVSRLKAPKPIYRLRAFPQPSGSRETATTVTVSDMRAVAGLHRVDEVWVERLIGFKLLPEGTLAPACGYL